MGPNEGDVRVEAEYYPERYCIESSVEKAKDLPSLTAAVD